MEEQGVPRPPLLPHQPLGHCSVRSAPTSSNLRVQLPRIHQLYVLPRPLAEAVNFAFQVHTNPPHNTHFAHARHLFKPSLPSIPLQEEIHPSLQLELLLFTIHKFVHQTHIDTAPLSVTHTPAAARV
jgi:hypothetical protein